MRAFEPDEFSSGSSFTDAELIFLRGRSEKSPRPTGGAGRYDRKKKGEAVSAPDEFSSAAFFTDAELIFLRERFEKSPRPTGKAGRYDEK